MDEAKSVLTSPGLMVSNGAAAKFSRQDFSALCVADAAQPQMHDSIMHHQTSQMNCKQSTNSVIRQGSFFQGAGTSLLVQPND
jgi:hypothetical protein